MNRAIGIGVVAFALLAQNPVPMNGPKGDHGFDVVLPDLPPGEHYLKVTVATDGSATSRPLSVANGPTPPSPTPPGPPTPSPVLTDRAKALKVAAEKATADPDRANTAVGLAALYREIAKVAPQATSEAAIAQATTAATELFLLNRHATTAWQPFRDQLSTEWTKLRAKSAPPADYGVLLGEAADALEATAPRRAIDPAIWQFILEILKIILPLLIPH